MFQFNLTLVPSNSVFFMGKAARNAPRYCKGRDDVCSAIATSTNTQRFPFPTTQGIFLRRWQLGTVCFWLLINVQGGAVILKVSHRMGDGQIFLKGSMHASPYRLRPLLARSTSRYSTFNGWLPFMSTLHWTVVCSSQRKLNTATVHSNTPSPPPCFHQLEHKKEPDTDRLGSISRRAAFAFVSIADACSLCIYPHSFFYVL
jgi:hypothetical protein